MEISIDSGELGLAPSPDHVNLIVTDGEHEEELRLQEHEKNTLSHGMAEDATTNVDLEDGVVAWEPGRGLWIEAHAGESFYVILSPEERETVARALRDTEVGR